ncbi:hypothetical protein T01_11869 [Trichinella spiralis]|uniref:Uncharacterized protein n=1 Tax=Trichinella spiralis TaxID=6334 RepID=A0A0V1BUL7_TRISP|nr:hypothetical protein T01_11869 [Trichinella spiralis]
MSIYFIRQSETRIDDDFGPCPLHHSPPHEEHVPCSLPASVRNLGARLVAASFSSPVVSPGLLLLHECRDTASVGRSVLPAVLFHLPPSLSGTCSNPASSGPDTDRPSTPQIWSLWGVASTPDRQARRQVRRLSDLSMPFGVVVPGQLSFGPPRTPAPNLCAGAVRIPLRTSLVHPSALRTSGPLVAGALCRTERDWEWPRLCSEHWFDKPAVSGRGRHPNLPDGRWTPSLACPPACGSSVLPSRLTAGGKRWPGFSSRQTAGTPPSPAPTRNSGLGRSAVSPAHRSGRKRRSLKPSPLCAPQRWAGGTPPATWRSSRTPLGCSDYHSVSPPRVPQGP